MARSKAPAPRAARPSTPPPAMAATRTSEMIAANQVHLAPPSGSMVFPCGARAGKQGRGWRGLTCPTCIELAARPAL